MSAVNLGFFNTSTSRTHVRFPFSTHAAAGANVAPLSGFEAADLKIYRAADGAAISATDRSSASGITMTSPFDSLTGFHTVDIDLTDNADSGFYAAGYAYFVVLAPDSETIDSQTITGVLLATFEIGGQPVNVTQFGGTGLTSASGIPEVKVASIASAAITAASIASDAITAAKLASDVATEIQSGLATAAALTTAQGTLTKLETAIELDGSVYRFTTNALEQAPSGGGGGSADWTADEKTVIKAVLGIPASGTTPDDPTTGILDTIRDAALAVKAKTDNLPSDPADASDVAGSFSTVNTKLDAIDDFIDTEVAAIKAVTDKLDDTLEDDGGTYRFTTNALEQAPSGGGGGSADWTADEKTVIKAVLGIPASGTTPDDPTTGILDTIRDAALAVKAKTDNLSSDPADASDVAGAFSIVNAKLDTIDDYIDTEVAAIKAKTDNLPSDPADASDIAAAFATVNSKLDAIDDYVDSEVAAIKAKTDNLPSDPADNSDILGAIAALNNISTAQVNAEVDSALADINLDHLAKSAVDTNLQTTVHSNSVLGYILAKSAVSNYSRTTDSLEAQGDANDKIRFVLVPCFTTTEGTTLRWIGLVYKQGEWLDVHALDPTATCEIAAEEYAAAHSFETDPATITSRGWFELSYASPNLNDDRHYVYTATVVISGITYTFADCLCNLG